MSNGISRRGFMITSVLAALGAPQALCGLTNLRPDGTPADGTPVPDELSPELALLLGEERWQVAENFSAYTVFVGLHNIDYVDLSSPGQVATRDPLGEKDVQPESADDASNRVQLLLIPNIPQMTAEMARNIEREPAHDSQAIWALGSGDLEIIYYWNGGGGTTKLTGHVENNLFHGNRDGQEAINMPASFQTAHFDTEGNIDQVPAAILVSVKADPSTYLNFTTGPTSFDDTDGSGHQDWQDAGWKFSQ